MTDLGRRVPCRCGDATVGVWWERATVPAAGFAAEVRPVAERVCARYATGDRASNKFQPESRGRSQLEVTFAGLLAERVVADVLGEPWNAGDEKLANVGADIEVRFVFDGSPWRLSVFERDVPERRFVLTTGQAGQIVLLGWSPGSEVLERGEPRPAGWEPGRWLDWTYLHRLPLVGRHVAA